MEPFKITCVSCRAALTVRKESMIGQIIACPRCNMMVQVLPPAGYVAAEKSIATEKVTPEPESVVAEKPTGASPPSPPPVKPASPVGNARAAAATAAVVTTLFDATDALADAPPPAPSAVSAPTDPVFAATFDDAVDAFSDPPAPSKTLPPAEPQAKTPRRQPARAEASPAAPPSAADAIPSAASRWATLKFPVMITGGAIAGAAIVATALTLLSGDDSAPPIVANANITPPVAGPASPDAPAASANVPPVEPPPALPVEENESTAAADDAANIEATADVPLIDPPQDNAAQPELKSSDAVADPNSGPAATEIVADAPDDAPPANASVPADEETAEAEQPKLRIDPLDIDPEGLNLSTLYSGPAKDPLAASQLPGEAPGVELSVPAPQEAPPEGAADEPADAPVAPGAVRRDEQAVGAPGAAFAALLARKTPELKVEEMPLCRLLDLSVQLSGVPISVAPEQLRLAAVSAGQPTTADVKNAGIEEFLTAALKPLRLQPVVVNEQIVLIRGTNNPRSERTFPIDDLASDDDAVERLVAVIEQVVAPESWQSAGGDGTIVVDGKQLKINAGEAIQYDVLLLLERSRAALGKPARSKYPAALIGADAAPVALAERLSAPATFTFSQYSPLREIFRHWQEEAQVAVLVDWPALADLRLWPNTRIACSSADKSWEEALDAVLEPLGLAWRPIDKRTIEITTLDKAASAPLLEIYRLNPEALAEIDNLTGELDQVAIAAGAPGGAGMANELLGENSLLIARQPAIVQRAIADDLAGKGLLATE